MPPKNPLLAISHSDPYPYYQSLLEKPALWFDAELKLWIASRAEVIDKIFVHPHCAVRPDAEPVPKAIAASTITATAMEYLLESELNLSRDALEWAYWPSLNGRISVFSNLNNVTTRN